MLLHVIPDISLFSWNELIALSLGLLSVGIVVYRMIAEHERKRKQSTIDAVRVVKDNSSELRRTLRAKMRNNGDVLDYEKLSPKLKNDMREYLDDIEYLCVGINTGIYDFEIFNRMTGDYYLLAVLPVLRPLIDEFQVNHNQLTAYIEFELVCKRIEGIIKQRDEKLAKFKEESINPGNLKYS